MTPCAGCGRPYPPRAFLVRDKRKKGAERVARYCPSCRAAYRAAQLERAAAGSRARADNPRARGTNPRARGTNPHPGKAEAAGQWRAAFRRLDRTPPDELHELERECARALERFGPSPELLELERRIAGALTRHK